jgi:cystathionine beta-lyase family protein involved in aluminum resistance
MRWADRPELIIFVDNCYGEFVEEREPCMVGADLVAGSLIKNPGESHGTALCAYSGLMYCWDERHLSATE